MDLVLGEGRPEGLDASEAQGHQAPSQNPSTEGEIGVGQAQGVGMIPSLVATKVCLALPSNQEGLLSSILGKEALRFRGGR